MDEGQGVIFIGGKQLFELDPSNKKYLSLIQHKDRIKNELTLKENMILITCSGTIGKVTLVPRHWEGWTANQHIIRIIPSSKAIAGYLFTFLNSDIGRLLIQKHTYGSVIDEIDRNHVADIPIPILDDDDIQNSTFYLEVYMCPDIGWVAEQRRKDSENGFDWFLLKSYQLN